jgi:hypothetical protein
MFCLSIAAVDCLFPEAKATGTMLDEQQNYWASIAASDRSSS